MIYFYLWPILAPRVSHSSLLCYIFLLLGLWNVDGQPRNPNDDNNNHLRGLTRSGRTWKWKSINTKKREKSCMCVESLKRKCDFFLIHLATHLVSFHQCHTWQHHANILSGGTCWSLDNIHQMCGASRPQQQPWLQALCLWHLGKPSWLWDACLLKIGWIREGWSHKKLSKLPIKLFSTIWITMGK